MEMEQNGAAKGALITDTPGKHIYYKGAYVLEVPAPAMSNWDADNKELQQLQPVSAVRELIENVERMNGGQNLADMVGVHVRNKRLSEDIGAVKDVASEYGSAASQTMDHWRQMSSFRVFLPRLEALRQQDPNLRVFVASDTASIVDVFREKLGEDAVVYVPRSCDNREMRCIQLAFADALCLARTKRLLGSNWSSFTELAQRLGAGKAELAGKDFFPVDDAESDGSVRSSTALDSAGSNGLAQGGSNQHKQNRMSSHVSF